MYPPDAAKCAAASLTCSSVTGRPSFISALARATQSFLQVVNFLSAEKMYCISSLAYRVQKGLS